MSAPERLHALDAVRGFALLLGIVLHATMSFFLPIPALDSSQSSTLSAVFYVIHIFRMSLFYLIAGFFAHMALHRKGTRAFVKDRSKRILVPMIAGWLVLMPTITAIVVWGVTRTAGEAVAAAPASSPSLPSGLPLTHLWFLYYLSMFYALALVVRAAFEHGIDRSGRLRSLVDRVLGLILPNALGAVLLAVPVALTLVSIDAWVPWGGIPTPDYGLTPQWPAMICFGLAFAVGWFVHRQMDLLSSWNRRWPQFLVPAVLLTAACLWLLEPTAPDSLEPPALSPDLTLAYALAYGTAVWCWTFGLIGAALRFCSGPSATRRYIADSSYWLYLAHLPLVFFLQVVVADWPLHWMIKFPAILAVALGILLLSYHYLVRPTAIGEILNGRRVPRSGHGDRSRAVRPRSDHPGTDATAPVVGFHAASKHFGTTRALDGLDLEVRRGELLALLGPNGAGKTTAISLSLGLLEPDAGEVTLMGGSPLAIENRLEVGMMLQEVNLAPALRPRELIELVSSYYPSPMAMDEVLAATGIEAFADRPYGKLSGGQKRRVQFAAAVCGNPRLLFLDEPTVGLDVEARQGMWRAIRQLIDSGCSIVLTTHYLEEAEALADRVAVLVAGRLVALGSVDEMRSLVSRKLIRCVTSLSAEQIRGWPEVVEVIEEEHSLAITAVEAEEVVRRLLAADAGLARLEVKQASLAEAFAEITREVA